MQFYLSNRIERLIESNALDMSMNKPNIGIL